MPGQSQEVSNKSVTRVTGTQEPEPLPTHQQEARLRSGNGEDWCHGLTG